MENYNYSVLMSVYNKEKPEYLRESMTSILNQTYKTNDFVLVCDGVLSEELDLVINDMKKQFGEILHVERIHKNVGLGMALKRGIILCKNEYIARMDSDDISKQDRCYKEIEIFKNNKEIGIVGSLVEEFSEDINRINSYRVVPEKNDEILKFAKKRNPFNHPTVMFKKSVVLNCNNYKNVRYMQDYFLWIDMISNNVKGYNIQEPLVAMRVDKRFFKRKSGIQYLSIQMKLLKYMREKNIINIFEYFELLILRTGSCISPNFLRQFAFKKILRKNKLEV